MPHRLIRSQVNSASPDDRRTEHAHAAIAGNISYRLGGDDAAGIETIRANVVAAHSPAPTPESVLRRRTSPRSTDRASNLPFFPWGEEILMIAPPPWARMILSASRLHRNVPLRLVSRTLRHTSSGVSANAKFTGPPRGQAKPALFTRTSRRENLSRVRRKRSATSRSEVTSARTPKTFSGGNAKRAAAASTSACARSQSDNPRARLRKRLNDLPTDPARRAGDESNFAVKFHCQKNLNAIYSNRIYSSRHRMQICKQWRSR